MAAKITSTRSGSSFDGRPGRRMKADARLHDIPVIMVSALDATDSVIRAIEAGAEDYLPKPVDSRLLKARINACLERKRWRDRGALSADRPAVEDEPSTVTGEPPDLSKRDRTLRRELVDVLDEADGRLANNRHLTARNLANLLARQGKYRFTEQTLRKIIGRRYPPLRRLGIIGHARKD